MVFLVKTPNHTYLYKIVKNQGGFSVKSIIATFRIEKQLLEKFDISSIQKKRKSFLFKVCASFKTRR
ncbi:hypothetical protein CW712_01800 [Candidatus Bathyarchaeota archaeon]|nr:MAG: hypothetical protein CW712_01800 [Candidatus Bathyarchaeota archaeon]